jgi:hypothetical protein
LEKEVYLSAALALKKGIGLWNVLNETAPNVWTKEPAVHTAKKGGSVDLEIAGEEKLVESLKKRENVCKCIPAEAEKAVCAFLKEKVPHSIERNRNKR